MSIINSYFHLLFGVFVYDYRYIFYVFILSLIMKYIMEFVKKGDK